MIKIDHIPLLIEYINYDNSPSVPLLLKCILFNAICRNKISVMMNCKKKTLIREIATK